MNNKEKSHPVIRREVTAPEPITYRISMRVIRFDEQYQILYRTVNVKKKTCTTYSTDKFWILLILFRKRHSYVSKCPLHSLQPRKPAKSLPARTCRHCQYPSASSRSERYMHSTTQDGGLLFIKQTWNELFHFALCFYQGNWRPVLFPSVFIFLSTIRQPFDQDSDVLSERQNAGSTSG